MVWKEYRPE